MLRNHLSSLFSDHPALIVCERDIAAAYSELSACFRNGGKLLVCGNGGSAADSAHIVGELMKGFHLKRKIPGASGPLARLQGALPAIDLTAQSGLISAFANDEDPAYVYAQQVWGYSRDCPRDVLLGLSTSGNSENVVRAAETAKALGLTATAITGESESRLSELCKVCVRLPAAETYRIQEFTMPVYHCLCAALEEEFFTS